MEITSCRVLAGIKKRVARTREVNNGRKSVRGAAAPQSSEYGPQGRACCWPACSGSDEDEVSGSGDSRPIGQSGPIVRDLIWSRNQRRHPTAGCCRACLELKFLERQPVVHADGPRPDELLAAGSVSRFQSSH